jgi:hypothetical protein
MDAIFWFGLVLGALFGLVVDLWKRPLEHALQRRLEAKTTTRATQISERLANDRQGLRDFLVVQILEISLIGSLGGILSGILFTAPSVLYAALGTDVDPSWIRLGTAFTVLGQIVAVVVAGWIVRIASDAIRIARMVAAGPMDEPAAKNANP